MLRLLAFLGLARLAACGGIVIEPLPEKTGPVKILVYVHGAFVNEKYYQSACRALQSASPLKLWVGLPSFILDTPNPGTITSAVTGMVKKITKQGNLNVSTADVFVAGHSLGGVFAPAVVKSKGYAGLLEFGSYVTQGQDITTTSYPVLTLGGELDGLTRVSRIAVEYAKMVSLPARERLRKPVVVLPGVCHSQFCEGVNVTSFGHHDLAPEVSWKEAHEQIASVAAAFLTITVNQSAAAVAEATHLFESHWKYTDQLVQGFLSAKGGEEATSSASNWCATVQTSVVAPRNSSSEYTASVRVVNAAELAVSHPSIDAASAPVDVGIVSHAAYALNPIDVSTVPVAATSLTCEMSSEDAIALARKQPGAGGKTPLPNRCRDANAAAITAAESMVTAPTLARFKAKGRAFSMVDDEVAHTGVGFLSSSLTFDTSSTPVRVGGVALATATSASVFPGVYQCIVLSPAKAIEWMMVDSLPVLA